MMIKEQIINQIKKKRSFLCVGLDSDIDRIPLFLKNEKDPIFEFNRRIIDATKDFCVAYKPNLAFYEAMGPKGWEALEKTMAYIARVSNPNNQKNEDYSKLLSYCIKNEHWSVFEQAFMTLQIETNRGIAAQIL